MKSLKVRLFIMLSLFVSQYNFIQTSEAQLNLNSSASNKEVLFLSGWKPRNVLSKKGIKPNQKTIEALDKFKNISALNPYFKKAKGYAVFPNIGKAGIGIGGARGKGEVFEKDKLLGLLQLHNYLLGCN